LSVLLILSCKAWERGFDEVYSFQTSQYCQKYHIAVKGKKQSLAACWPQSRWTSLNV